MRAGQVAGVLGQPGFFFPGLQQQQLPSQHERPLPMPTIPLPPPPPPPIQHPPSSGASQPQHDVFDFSKHVPVIQGTMDKHWTAPVVPSSQIRSFTMHAWRMASPSSQLHWVVLAWHIRRMR
eukprot:123951-Pelagomonas_calceolata.AAC.1